jgi:hypothetical protein
MTESQPSLSNLKPGDECFVNSPARWSVPGVWCRAVIIRRTPRQIIVKLPNSMTPNREIRFRADNGDEIGCGEFRKRWLSPTRAGRPSYGETKPKEG